jgi:hypothetical protein
LREKLKDQNRDSTRQRDAEKRRQRIAETYLWIEVKARRRERWRKKFLLKAMQ